MAVALHILQAGEKPEVGKPTKAFTAACGGCERAQTCFQGLDLEEAVAALERSGADHVDVVMSGSANSCADARASMTLSAPAPEKT